MYVPQIWIGVWNVTVAAVGTPLRPKGEQAVLGVSSFGLSGTNAHAVIGEYVAVSPADSDDDHNAQLLVLSARTPAALHRLASRWAAYLGPDGPGRAHRLRDADSLRGSARRWDRRPGDRDDDSAVVP